MPRRPDRRTAGVIVASAALHLGVLVLLALKPTASVLKPYEENAIAVTLAPLYLVEPKLRSRQAPVRPRKARRPAEDTAVAPFYTAPAPGRAGPGAARGIGIGSHPAPQPAGPQAELGRALKFGGVGCDNPRLVGMSQAERDHCAERLGDGAKTAAYLGQGLSKAKQAEFDAISTYKEAVRKYQEAPIPPGLSTSDAAGGLTGLGASRPTKAHPF